MTKSLVFLAKTIGLSKRCGRKPSTLAQAARHNLREIQAESGGRLHINMHLSSRNVILHGAHESSAIVALSQSLMEKHAIRKSKLRRDHVQALEFVISLPNSSDIDLMAYFEASKHWIEQVFGSQMLLSAVVHLDEETPHMHALVLPIVEGRYEGGAPLRRQRLAQLVQRFSDEVGKPFGLSLESKVRLTSGQRAALAKLVLDYLSKCNDSVMTSCIWKVVFNHIKLNPLDFSKHLELKLPKVKPTAKQRTMSQIFTATGKKTSEDRAFLSNQYLPSVGFGKLQEPKFSHGT